MINIFDKNITADPNQEFFYKIGRVSTNLIWNRPTFLTTQNLLLDIKNKSSIFERYTVYLMGGITWNFSDTWDIDIVLCSNSYDIVGLEDDLDFINNLALNKHKLLTDVQWKREPIKPLTYDYLLNNNFTRYEFDYVKIGYVHKIMNGQEKIMDNTEKLITKSGRKIKKLSQYLCLYEGGNQIHSEKIINRLKNTVNGEARFDFLAEDFINYDEQYFDSIKNKFV